MNPFHILTRGVKFDFKKFENDAKKFNIANKRQVPEESNNSNESNKKKPKKNVESIEEMRSRKDIFVDGADVDAPIESFDQLEIGEYLKDNLKKSHYLEPTACQMQVVPLMMSNRDVICCSPTGSGKTLAFSIPIIAQLRESKNEGFRAIVLAPTRELAKQIHRECLWIAHGSGLRIHLIKNVNLAGKKFNSSSRLKYDILVTTPNRLVFLLKQNCIRVENVEWLVVDECDRLFHSSFKDQLASIFQACSESPRCHFAFFSATLNRQLESWAKLNFDGVVTVCVGGFNKVVDTVEQQLSFVGNESGKLLALKNIILKGCQPPVLIFVNKMNKANFIMRELLSINMNAAVIHAGKSQEYRDKVIRSFREGKIFFLICTELMGRGVDFKAVNLVINYDLPSNTFDYIHHIGRTGRAGRKGMAVTFYTQNDEEKLPSIVKVMKFSGCDLPAHLLKLNKRNIHKLKQFEMRMRRKRSSSKKKEDEDDEEEHFEDEDL